MLLLEYVINTSVMFLRQYLLWFGWFLFVVILVRFCLFIMKWESREICCICVNNKQEMCLRFTPHLGMRFRSHLHLDHVKVTARLPFLFPSITVLWQLHWLPVRQHVVFKIVGLVHQSLAGAAPAYLADDCCLLSDVGHCPLRSNSSDMRKLFVPRTHNKLGDRSFSAAGPRLWNDLPPGLRRPGLTFDSFRKSLKTHLFGDWSA